MSSRPVAGGQQADVGRHAVQKLKIRLNKPDAVNFAVFFSTPSCNDFLRLTEQCQERVTAVGLMQGGREWRLAGQGAWLSPVACSGIPVGEPL